MQLLTQKPEITAKNYLSVGPGEYPCGNNLYLIVTPSGGRRWAFRYQRNGIVKKMGFGSAWHQRETSRSARQIIKKILDAAIATICDQNITRLTGPADSNRSCLGSGGAAPHGAVTRRWTTTFCQRSCTSSAPYQRKARGRSRSQS